MAIAAESSIIIDWPSEGANVAAALQHTQLSYPYADNQLRALLISRDLTLVGQRASAPGVDVVISGPMAQILQFYPDRDAVQLCSPGGGLLHAVRIYVTARWMPKPEPKPLAVTIKGAVVLAQEHRSEDGEIVKAAEEEFPEGWRSVRTKTLVVNRVLNRMNWDSSKRDRVLRALGWRKG